MEDFKKRVEKWRARAIERHKVAQEENDSEECNYQKGKIDICDAIIKDIENGKQK